MRLLHTGDLHLGKRLGGVSLLEDQTHVLDQIAQLAREHRAEGVIIAGDVYDQSVPPAEAVELLDGFLDRLTGQGMEVYMVAGNHDSGRRLDFARELLARQGVYIAGCYRGAVERVDKEDEFGLLSIYLLPFIKPASVYPFHGPAASYQQAVETALERTLAVEDPARRSVLVAHQFVTAAGRPTERSESEVIPVGGVDNVDASAFDGFDYVALGHIHKAQEPVEGRVRYAGSPLQYSFSEWRNEKSVTLVELGEKGRVELTALALTPLRQMRQLEGRLEDLLAHGAYSEDFFRAVITNEEPVADAAARLKVFYPNLLTLEFSRMTQPGSAAGARLRQIRALTPLELMDTFFESCYGRPMSLLQRRLAQEALKEETHETQ